MSPVHSGKYNCDFEQILNLDNIILTNFKHTFQIQLTFLQFSRFLFILIEKMIIFQEDIKGNSR